MHTEILYFDAGGGHRAAAQALATALGEDAWRWQPKPVNLREVLDPQGRLKRWGLEPDALYNARIQAGFTQTLGFELKLLQTLLRGLHRPLQRRMAQHWAQQSDVQRPRLVVSVVPNVNRVLARAVQQALPGVPFVTLMTDLADLPPDFWRVDGEAQHLICPTPKALQQALAGGHPRERLHLCQGALLRSGFEPAPAGEPLPIDPARMGLDPRRPTTLVMFGGLGSREMLATAQRLQDHQLILLCGRNPALAEALLALRPRARHVVLTHTEQVPALMQLADCFLGKPGPAAISEALTMGLPVVTLLNAATLPQERYNARWIAEHGYGVVAPSVDAMPAALERVLSDLPAFRARAGHYRNRARQEVPALLRRIVQQPDRVGLRAVNGAALRPQGATAAWAH